MEVHPIFRVFWAETSPSFTQWARVVAIISLLRHISLRVEFRRDVGVRNRHVRTGPRLNCDWYFLVILIYNIYNKILKLDCLGHFYFWPLLASFRGHWKTFLHQFGLFTLLMVNMNASYPILSGLVNNRAFKGQNVKADPKNWKIWKKCIKQKILVYF